MRWSFVLLVICLLGAGFLAQDDTLIGDEVPGLAAGYSFEKLRLAYDGPAVRVRRSSDNATQDIGFEGNQFDRAAYEAFVNGDTAFVRLLYDQSGHRYDALQPDLKHQPWITDGPNGTKVLSVRGHQGMGMPGAYETISGADELTIFLLARWDGSPSEDHFYLLNAGQFAPAAGNWPLAIYLRRTTIARLAGRPVAQLKLSNGSFVTLTAEGVYGRPDVYQIYELVLDNNGTVAFYNSGRLVDKEKIPDDLSILAADPYGDGLFFGANGNFEFGLSGEIAPPLIYGRALADSERVAVRQALANRYGLMLPHNAPPSGDEFTIVFIPDTQEYAAEVNGAQPEMIQDVMDWIRKNQSSWNIQLVLHAGDLVRAGRREDMWERVDKWFTTLDATGIPYAVVPGNHDYQGQGGLENRNSTNFNTYFPTSRFTNTPWWNGGFYESDKTDNFYFTRRMGGEEYLILTMEFQPRSGVIAWANDVLTAHADKKAIILTHDFMTEEGRLSESTLITNNAASGQELYNKLISRHDNIFLILSGHHGLGTARRFDRKTGAHYMFFDPMFLDWGQQGFVRLLVVSPSKGTIRVMTYSPHRNEYRSDYQNLFAFDIESSGTSTGRTKEYTETITGYALHQNYPNPFNSSTRINYVLPEGGITTISIYDVLGRKVRELVDGYRRAGAHSILFDGEHLPSGLYIYKMESGSFTETRTMILLK